MIRRSRAVTSSDRPARATLRAACLTLAMLAADPGGTAMADQHDYDAHETVARRAGRVPAPEAPADALSLTLTPRTAAGEPALELSGFFNLDVALLGRHGGEVPGAVFAVLVERDTAQVHAGPLRNDDEPPAPFRPSAPPMIVLQGPGGEAAPTAAPITMKGHFSADLAAHLGLPTGAGVYDGFLWLEDVLSPMAAAAKPDEAMALPAPPPPPAGPAPELAVTGIGADLVIHARPGAAPIAIIVMAPASGLIGSASFPAGARAAASAASMIPGWTPGERVFAVAVADGARSVLYDSAAAR